MYYCLSYLKKPEKSPREYILIVYFNIIYKKNCVHLFLFRSKNIIKKAQRE